MNWLVAQGERLVAGAARTGPPADRSPFPDALTAREVDVLSLLAKRYSNNEIATELVLSVLAVERSIAILFGKAGIHSRREARLYAEQHGLIAPA